MDIGIGLPNAVRGVDRAGTVEWARRADDAGFSSLGTIDRLAYSELRVADRARGRRRGHRADPAGHRHPDRAAAGQPALLAKQAATLDGISDGRLSSAWPSAAARTTSRPSGVDFHRRGRIFDRQLEELVEFWRGEGDVGPAAGAARPALLIGGAPTSRSSAPRSTPTAGRWAAARPRLRAGAGKLREAWEAEGREGEPRTMALFYYALGDGAEEAAREDLADYYAWLGDYAEQIVASAATDADTVRATSPPSSRRAATRSSASRRRPTRGRSICSRRPCCNGAICVVGREVLHSEGFVVPRGDPAAASRRPARPPDHQYAPRVARSNARCSGVSSSALRPRRAPRRRRPRGRAGSPR